MTGRLAGKVIWVTGGCAGIRATLARAFAKYAWLVRRIKTPEVPHLTPFPHRLSRTSNKLAEPEYGARMTPEPLWHKG